LGYVVIIKKKERAPFDIDGIMMGRETNESWMPLLYLVATVALTLFVLMIPMRYASSILVVHSSYHRPKLLFTMLEFSYTAKRTNELFNSLSGHLNAQCALSFLIALHLLADVLYCMDFLLFCHWIQRQKEEQVPKNIRHMANRWSRVFIATSCFYFLGHFSLFVQQMNGANETLSAMTGTCTTLYFISAAVSMLFISIALFYKGYSSVIGMERTTGEQQQH
jgi:hypothetical protein